MEALLPRLRLSINQTTADVFITDPSTSQRTREREKKKSMASLTMAFTPAAGRVFAAKTTSTKGSGEIKEEKGFLDWFLGGLAKEESLLEVDPILKKVEEKNNGGGKKNSVAVPPKKNGGFGGLFAKK